VIPWTVVMASGRSNWSDNICMLLLLYTVYIECPIQLKSNNGIFSRNIVIVLAHLQPNFIRLMRVTLEVQQLKWWPWENNTLNHKPSCLLTTITPLPKCLPTSVPLLLAPLLSLLRLRKHDLVDQSLVQGLNPLEQQVCSPHHLGQ
jgi:hypothetical protein